VTGSLRLAVTERTVEVPPGLRRALKTHAAKKPETRPARVGKALGLSAAGVKRPR
jgi:hypothetical protein